MHPDYYLKVVLSVKLTQNRMYTEHIFFTGKVISSGKLLLWVEHTPLLKKSAKHYVPTNTRYFIQMRIYKEY